jgi:hypothetical protein
MKRRRFCKDEGARVSFALVALLILAGSSVLSGIVSKLAQDPNSGKGQWATVEEGAILAIESEILELSNRTATAALKEGLSTGQDLSFIYARFQSDFKAGFSQDTVNQGWEIRLEGFDFGLDLGTMPNGRVVGIVNWTARASSGLFVKRTTAVSQDLGSPLALAASMRDRLQMSGNESSELSNLVRGMLYRLVAMRTANGVLDGASVLTTQDIDVAFDLALDLMMCSGAVTVPTRRRDGNSSSSGPADLFLQRLNITTIKSSSVLAQYIMGLLDYYLLWFRDYTGIGEAAEAFFRWVGDKTSADDNLTRARDQWWKDFKVRYMVERWAFDVLAGLLHVAFEMSGDENIDVSSLSIEDLSHKVQGAVNTSAKELGPALEGPHAWEGLRPPDELNIALANMPSKDAQEKELVLGLLQRSLISTDLKAAEGLLDIGRARAASAWEDLAAVDEMGGFSPEAPQMLQNASGSTSTSKGLVIFGVSIQWKDLAYNSTVEKKGIHDTAPEDRLKRSLDAAMEPGNGILFKEVRPYETDFRIVVLGTLEVRKFLFSRGGNLDLGPEIEELEVRFNVPINITMIVPVFTGVPLSGVDYSPSDTLGGDLKEAAWEFINVTWSNLQWAAGALTELKSGVVSGLKELGRRGLNNLAKTSAGHFSHVVEDVMKAIYAKAWNKAINRTWGLVRELFGDELRDMLTFNVTIQGYDLWVIMDPFAESLTVSHLSEGLFFNLTIKRLAEENPPFKPVPVEGFYYALLGTIVYTKGDLTVCAGLDPLTVVQPSPIHVVAQVRDKQGKGYRFELDAPVVQRTYLTKEFSLSTLLKMPLKGIPVPGTELTFDIDAGLRVFYGSDVKKPEKLLIKAVRDAWYTTLEGYSIKAVYDELGDPVLLEAFLLHLLNNVIHSIEDVADEELPEIEVFVELKVSAGLGTASGGLGLSFVIEEPVRVLLYVLPWITENLRAFLLNLAQPEMKIATSRAPSMVLEHLYVRGTVSTEAGLPEAFGGDRFGMMTFATRIEANVPALGALIGKDLGRWKVQVGVLLPNIPSAVVGMIPGMDPPKPRCDLWLVEFSIMELDNDRAKLSEIYYDTKGFDPKEEFVEIWNPTNWRIDLSRWVLADQGGRWDLPDHVTLPPGGRLVVARNRDGFRALFGKLPEISGLTLSLNNDGDSMVLYDPWGVQIDAMAWDSGLHGWDLKCKSGESLHRGAADTDTPGDWYCAVPDPGI